VRPPQAEGSRQFRIDLWVGIGLVAAYLSITAVLWAGGVRGHARPDLLTWGLIGLTRSQCWPGGLSGSARPLEGPTRKDQFF
jgi:hypothetical protein